MFEAGEVEVTQQFELERAMEALVLALGLRMIRTAMGDADPEPNQPQTKGGERLSSSRAPRRALSISIATGKPYSAKNSSFNISRTVCSRSSAQALSTSEKRE